MNNGINSKIYPNRRPLYLLVIVFVLPIVIAWLLVQSPETLRTGSLLNKGVLLQPPLDIKSEKGLKALQDIKLEPSEWGAILFSDSMCESECANALAKLIIIRDLLGHSGSRVKLAGLFRFPTDMTGLYQVTGGDIVKDLSSLLASRFSEEAVKNGIIFLDWRGQIVSYFKLDADPSDIKKDLKRLLRASKIK